MKTYILYNPLAGNGRSKSDAELINSIYIEEDAEHYDMTKIGDYSKLFAPLKEDSAIVICGGDGTLNKFINDTRSLCLNCKIYYYPSGYGNDFARDIGHAENKTPFLINDCIKDLPQVTINGRQYGFINGVGYGIDGYCCEEGDKLKSKAKKVNYTSIAIKGLLFHYKPTKATVTVDGKTHTYDKVWLAPTMKGRFYGGGMMPAPNQNRFDRTKEVSCMVFHGAGKLKALLLFPSIFKGTHIKHTNVVALHMGKEIEVTFDRPVPLQIDGETVPMVTSYRISV